ncbi:hypothetical protein OA93_04650 [Flavobacterium sp. KMS]|uniref:hypothetical protein n=1 Tax=Flavobacterium sp. KMS TaxID=1566023 RepID=UPI00057CA2A2|nr:hypothetical protein [Flavobacterium sp. KMS]KIA99460.1 hypothetical protein OA93_04650 [Flavobacterium sp. KMS]
MKIIKILSAVTFSVLLFSCGGKGTDKEEKSTDKKNEDIIADCNCSELTEADGELKGVTKKGSKELYTGVCIIKDQYDTITNKNTFKNGWLVNEIVKEKIGNEYIITKDIDYENGEPDTYKYVKTEENNSAKLTFVKNYKENKNKKAILDYNITIFSGEKFSLAVSTHYRDGEEFSHKNASPQPVCMLNSYETIDGGWRLDNLSQDRLYEVLDDLKKEIPHFNYWKN